jgi:hypothetical protein
MWIVVNILADKSVMLNESKRQEISISFERRCRWILWMRLSQSLSGQIEGASIQIRKR